MLNKTEFFTLNAEQIYQAILNGQVSLEQFCDWRQNLVEDERQDAYSIGYDAGYESAQEYYGDGPSS